MQTDIKDKIIIGMGDKMADRAYNTTLQQEESIAQALAGKANRSNFSYVCADEECQAIMYVRRGITPNFYSSRHTHHRKNCPFASYSKSDFKPPESVFDWLEEVLTKPDLPKEHQQDKINSSTGVHKAAGRLSHTARAMYVYQRSKELDEYLDEENTQSVLDFCISPRTAYYYENSPDKIKGWHLIIGKIKMVKFNGDYIILHVCTKGERAYHLRFKIKFTDDMSRNIYDDICARIESTNVTNQELCVMCKLESKEEQYEFAQGKAYKTLYKGIVPKRRLYFIP